MLSAQTAPPGAACRPDRPRRRRARRAGRLRSAANPASPAMAPPWASRARASSLKRRPRPKLNRPSRPSPGCSRLASMQFAAKAAPDRSMSRLPATWNRPCWTLIAGRVSSRNRMSSQRDGHRRRPGGTRPPGRQDRLRERAARCRRPGCRPADPAQQQRGQSQRTSNAPGVEPNGPWRRRSPGGAGRKSRQTSPSSPSICSRPTGPSGRPSSLAAMNWRPVGVRTASGAATR